MSEHSIDQALVQQVLKGDNEAFDILVLKYQNKLCQLVTRYVNDPSEAQDITQDTFIRAYRALPNFRGDSVFFTWIYRIAINTAKNYLKLRERRPPNFDIEVTEAEQTQECMHSEESPECQAQCEEMQTALLDALDALPENLRTSILLRELTDMSYEDIAKLLDCPVGTVRSRIFRARHNLDEFIKPYINE
ncbi:MAG: RNA polymerase sigma factor RpoE [Gammaproteobacteria bacterium]